MKAEYIPNQSKIIKLIQEKKSFLIVSHVYPDGDAIGSVLGISNALISLDKKVVAYIADRIPRQFSSLPGIDLVRTKYNVEETDATFVLDASNIERLGEAGNFISGSIINIDHHPDNSLFGDVNLVIPTASSTSEIVFNLLKYFPLNKEAVSALYYGLLSDTGGFMYNNTGEGTFKTALDMIRYGVSAGEIAYKVFYSIPYATMKIYIDVLKDIHIDKEVNLVWCILPLEVMESEAFQDNTSPLLDMLLKIEEAGTIVLFKEHKDKYRVSLRSKSKDVGAIARALGGGGHRSASAFDLLNKQESAIIDTLNKIKTLLGGQN
ncbi:TPA: bifunctional oligoribonuclease/PAP phosphatase NrnA [bacterium]|jgi:phosphoesterase RecJ-like protein|nr:bifunctional oligoribonuclease/PAP phosphatase NrnA [bacterium]